jgi:hypothetical protein
VICPTCNLRPRNGSRAWCRPCQAAYDRQHQRDHRAAVRFGTGPCPRCSMRPKVYGRPFCGPCLRAWEAEQRRARPPRPRCTRCGELPQKRDGRCVLCAPPLPSPSLETYAQERRGEQG